MKNYHFLLVIMVLFISGCASYEIKKNMTPELLDCVVITGEHTGKNFLHGTIHCNIKAVDENENQVDVEYAIDGSYERFNQTDIHISEVGDWVVDRGGQGFSRSEDGNIHILPINEVLNNRQCEVNPECEIRVCLDDLLNPGVYYVPSSQSIKFRLYYNKGIVSIDNFPTKIMFKKMFDENRKKEIEQKKLREKMEEAITEAIEKAFQNEINDIQYECMQKGIGRQPGYSVTVGEINNDKAKAEIRIGIPPVTRVNLYSVFLKKMNGKWIITNKAISKRWGNASDWPGY